MTSPTSQPAETFSGALRELVSLSVPAVITMTSYTAMQFVDTWVVSEVGPLAVGAVGNGGIAAFVPAVFMMGMLSLVSTYVSQHLGAGRPARGAAYVWNGIYLAVIGWALIMLPFAWALPQILGVMRSLMDAQPSEEVLAMELVYARVALGGMVLHMIGHVIGQYFYGLHRPVVVAVSAIAANVVNVPFSLFLVLGDQTWEAIGLPGLGASLEIGWDGLGVLGAAIGTIIGSAVGAAVPLAIFLSSDYRRTLRTAEAMRPNASTLWQLVRVGGPAGLMMTNEVFCWWIFMAVFLGRFGDEASAAGWIVLRYMHLSFMPAVGVSQALATIIGKLIGAGRKDLVASRAWMGVVGTGVYMGIWAVVFVLHGGELVGLFLDSNAEPELAPAIIAIGAQLMIVAAAFQVFDAMAITFSGVLRGAGDTLWPGVVALGLSWVFILGGGWLAVEFRPEWGAIGPWIGAALFILLYAVALGYRFLSGAWRRIELVEGREDAEVRAEFDPAAAHGTISGPHEVTVLPEESGVQAADRGPDPDPDETVEPPLARTP